MNCVGTPCGSIEGGGGKRNVEKRDARNQFDQVKVVNSHHSMCVAAQVVRYF